MARDGILTAAGGFLLALPLLPALAPAAASAGAICPETDSVALIAGKKTTAGEVKVCNDAETLSVTYEPTGPWCVTDTDLHVATSLDGIPRTRGGSPKPEEFAYGDPPEGEDCAVAFKIPLTEIGAEGVEAEDPVVIAARADLFVLESDRQEGAWAAGTRFTERGDWATYFTYTVEEALPCGGEDSKCVFVTSTTYNGNLGGLSGADAACQSRAEVESSLAAPGTYKAWLSNSVDSPAGGRFTQSSVPYRLVNGTEIASQWTDLVDGSLEAPIDRDEAGVSVSFFPVWTNTTVNGTSAFTGSSAGHCISWTPSLAHGLVGATDGTLDTWTHWTLQSCVNSGRLYCFQQ